MSRKPDLRRSKSNACSSICTFNTLSSADKKTFVDAGAFDDPNVCELIVPGSKFLRRLGQTGAGAEPSKGKAL